MSDNQVEEIKRKLNISDIISEYIKLTPAGANYKARCPFHNEKTPSFMVSDDKQIYHCFGCGKGGDIFSFVQEIEGLEFPEALRILAKKAGVQLVTRDPALQNKKTIMLEINKWAAAYFVKFLEDSSKAEIARDYLKKRKINQETIEDFKLGYSPEDWDSLNKFLIQKGFKEEDIFQAGLTVKKQRGIGYFDRFRKRLMFPISDTHGDIIGFTGRLLEEDEKSAKYVNTPQTLVYNKSQTLYGIEKAKSAIKEEKLAIIVEGNMDVLASYQAGVKNVVASSGIALTHDQIQLLRRFTRDVAFCFDQDIAGQEATRRALDQALAQDVNVKIIELPYGKDPDECISKEASLWKKAASSPKAVMEYYFNFADKKFDFTKVEDKKEAAKLLLPLISKLFDPIEKTHYLQKLAELINVEEEVLRDQLNKAKERKISGGTGPETTEKGQTKGKERNLMLSERIIGLALKYPENIPNIIENLEPEAVDSELRNLYNKLKIYYTKNQKFDNKGFLEEIRRFESGLLKKIDLLGLLIEKDFDEGTSEKVIKKEVTDSLRALRQSYICSELKKIGDKIKKTEESGNADQTDNLIQEFNRLTTELKNLS